MVLWTAYGCLCAFQTHYRSGLFGRPISFGSSFRYELSYSFIGILLTPLVIYLARRFRLSNSHWPRNLALHCLGMFVYASAAKLLWDLVADPPWAFFRGGASWVNLMKSITLGMDAGFPLYWVVVLSFYSYEYYVGLQRERLAAADLHRQFVDARLDALKMQLHPHFLFNTLNTISGLIHDDAACAEAMIARLSDFLRMSLEGYAVHEVTLAQELEFVRVYLAIEHVRFEDRLHVEFRIPPELEGALVPNLILQPLVENAVRHGLALLTDGGKLSIAAGTDKRRLVLSVKNDAPSDALIPGTEQEGIGLSNTRARLHRMYGDNQDLTIFRFDRQFEVRIRMPIESRISHVCEQGDEHARPYRG